MEPTLYAIIDAAVEKEFFWLLEHHNPPCACLYGEPIQPELITRAPYLIEVTEPVKIWLQFRTEEAWGIYLTSTATLRDLRHHLRKYLHVAIPSQTKPVYFRFYDPRVIWDFLSIVDDWTVFQFLGPIASIATHYQDFEKKDNFQAIRDKYPSQSHIYRKMLIFTAEQYAQFDQIARQKYCDQLVNQMVGDYFEQGTGMQVSIEHLRKLVEESLTFCYGNGISDDRSLRGFIKLLAHQNITEFEKIPKLWLEQLSHDTFPGYYRMSELLLNTLGYVPPIKKKD